MALKPGKQTPVVSIVTICYNQEAFIAQALDSFLMQKTDFPFEIVVADDCSTDNTPKIIAEYAKKHPTVIRALKREHNLGAQKNCVDALQQAKGDFVALCEGDDYWTDPHKLQLQVDFMKKHPQHAICFHKVKIVYEDKSIPDDVYPDFGVDHDLSTEELLRWNFIQTNSVMYRRQDYTKLPTNVLPLDWYLHLFHAKKGKIGFIDKIMSVYRKHDQGMWWESGRNDTVLLKKHGISLFCAFEGMIGLFGNNKEASKTIYHRMNDLLSKLTAIDAAEGTTIIETIWHDHLSAMKRFTSYQIEELKEREKVMQNQTDALTTNAAQLKTVNALLQKTTAERDAARATITELEGKIAHMQQTKSWRFRERYYRVHNAVKRRAGRSNT